jgi:hypothetical protein
MVKIIPAVRRRAARGCTAHGGHGNVCGGGRWETM